MKHSTKPRQESRCPAVSRAGLWWRFFAGMAGLAVAGVLVITFLGNRQQGENRLIGRWLRPDGGYVLEIKGVEKNGGINAAYFNPNPIHVASARQLWSDATVNVLIELRDVNYPGSTYALKYNPATDRLTGSYYQAVAKETYQIFFERVK